MLEEETQPLTSDAAALPALPHSPEAEQAVLGALLLDTDDAAAAVVEILRSDDFYSLAHRLIYRVFERHAKDGTPFDLVTVAEQLQKQGELEQVGGLEYLRVLWSNTPSAANIDVYAKIVRDSRLRRDLIKELKELETDCKQPEQRSAQELLDEAERRVLAVGDRHHEGGEMVPMPEALQEVFADLAHLQEHRLKNPHQLTGLATPLPWLNQQTSGLQRSDLIILAGRPGTGKTSLALNIANYAVSHQEAPVVIFSIEMSTSALVQRMLAAHSQVFLNRLRGGDLSKLNFDKLRDSAEVLKQWPLFIDASATMSPITMRGRLRRIVHASKNKVMPALVIVDYLQLMVSGEEANSRRGPENRNQEISTICRNLKALAKEFKCPVLALSQLSRTPEQGNRRPMLSDLRDSGAIEQDADLVLFLHRAKGPEGEEFTPNQSTDVELIIGKHRNGPVGLRKLSFQGALTSFMEQAVQADDDEGDEVGEDFGE